VQGIIHKINGQLTRTHTANHYVSTLLGIPDDVDH
jgi:hypothetical protein